eukprot:6301887-Ditylum_brightwellii.AAC.1
MSSTEFTCKESLDASIGCLQILGCILAPLLLAPESFLRTGEQCCAQQMEPTFGYVLDRWLKKAGSTRIWVEFILTSVDRGLGQQCNQGLEKFSRGWVGLFGVSIKDG